MLKYGRNIRKLVVIASSVVIMAHILCASSASALNDQIDAKDEQARINDKVARLKKELEGVRDLTFKKSVNLAVKQREEIRSLIEGMISREYPSGKLGILKKSLVELGFISGDVDLRRIFIDFYSSETAGFYDLLGSTLCIAADSLPEEVAQESPGEGDANEILRENLGISLGDLAIFHELQHALADQNFNFKSLVGNAVADFDRELSIMSVFEGDAYLSNLILIFSPLGIEAEVVRSEFAGTELLDEGKRAFREDLTGKYPSYFIATFLFPYHEGLDFVKEIYKTAKWEGVNSLYIAPPLSTEQILHPKKYMKEKDIPKEVQLRNILPALGKNWKVILKDTLGEFRMYLLIDQMLGKNDTALLASEGWGGDAYALYEDDRGEVVLSLSTVWDSEKDAQEFWEAFTRSLLAASYKVIQKTDKKAKNIESFIKDNREVMLKLEANSVEVLKASPEIIRKILATGQNASK